MKLKLLTLIAGLAFASSASAVHHVIYENDYSVDPAGTTGGVHNPGNGSYDQTADTDAISIKIIDPALVIPGFFDVWIDINTFNMVNPDDGWEGADTPFGDRLLILNLGGVELFNGLVGGFDNSFHFYNVAVETVGMIELLLESDTSSYRELFGVDYVKVTHSTVPDSGSTLALMGLGILGLIGVRKRFGK